MFSVTATWNPGLPGIAGAIALYLGMRISPKATHADASLRCRPAGPFTIDGGERVSGGYRQAVQTRFGSSCDGDWLSVVTWHDQFGPDAVGRKRHSDNTQSMLRCGLSSTHRVQAFLLRPALDDAMRLAGQAPKEAGRFIWLMTDGDPTDAEGKRVTDLQALRAQHRKLRLWRDDVRNRSGKRWSTTEPTSSEICQIMGAARFAMQPRWLDCLRSYKHSLLARRQS